MKTKDAVDQQYLKEKINEFEKRNNDMEKEYKSNSQIYKETIFKN